MLMTIMGHPQITQRVDKNWRVAWSSN